MDSSKLWPKSQKTSSNHWFELCARAGIIKEALIRPLLLAIRGVAPGDLQTHPMAHKPVYDDCGVLLVMGKDPVVFPIATHAYQLNSKLSPDADGDGVGDVGSIRPGSYVLHDLKNGKEIIFHIKNKDGTSKLPAWRDFDHNGKLTPEEMRKSEELRKGQQVSEVGAWADSVLLHGGLDSPADAVHKYSIACFTANTKWRQLISDEAKAYGGLCDLNLVDAEELLRYVDLLVTPGADEVEHDRS